MNIPLVVVAVVMEVVSRFEIKVYGRLLYNC